MIDSGLLHSLSDADRERLVASYYTVLQPGGSVYLLAFNEYATLPGPRRLTQVDIRGAFARGWNVETVSPSQFEVIDGMTGADAWLTTIRRLPESVSQSI